MRKAQELCWAVYSLAHWSRWNTFAQCALPWSLSLEMSMCLPSKLWESGTFSTFSQTALTNKTVVTHKTFPLRLFSSLPFCIWMELFCSAYIVPGLIRAAAVVIILHLFTLQQNNVGLRNCIQNCIHTSRDLLASMNHKRTIVSEIVGPVCKSCLKVMSFC